jgi:glycosyltransferase involved in cell wall biosynthesis
MKETYVIVPVFNEEIEVLKNTLAGLLCLFENIVLVNDGGDTLLKNNLYELSIHYLRHDINLGQGAALQTGMEYALSLGAQSIAFFDADGQHNPYDLRKMVSVLEAEELDVVMGSRFLKKDHIEAIPFSRRILLKAGTFVNFAFTGLLLSDAHHGLKVLNNKAAREIEFRQNRQLHATELLHFLKKYKLKYKELPAAVIYSSYSIKKGQKNWHFFKIFSDLIASKFLK